MNALLHPGPLAGRVDAPASKSYAHRALIAAALSEGRTRVRNLPAATDVQVTIGCLRALGAAVDGEWVLGIEQPRRSAILYCGESGTTLRFLLPITVALGMEARFLGAGRLPGRPIGPLVESLEAHGASFDQDAVPLTAKGPIRSGRFLLPGDVSSQFVTGLLFALPLLDSGSAIYLSTPLESAPYVEMTRETLERFSITSMVREDGFLVPGSQRYRSPGTIRVEGDWSSAAYFLAAGALGKGVTVRGLDLHSLQGDRRIIGLLRQFGAAVREGPGDAVHVRQGPLRGITADVSQVPDLFPLLAVLGAFAEGTTHLEGAKRLRLKESDRLASVSAMLQAIGVTASLSGDALTVQGGARPRGGEVDGAGDHRVVMAAAIAATACTGKVLIRGAQAVEKSFPTFFEAFSSLGGRYDGIDDR